LRRGILALAVVTGSGVGGASGAGAGATGGFVVKRNAQTIEVPAGRVTTRNLVYPDALKLGDSTYSGTVRILGPDPRSRGTRPRLTLIKVVSMQPAEGGSVLRVRIRNGNPTGTLAARAVITAITRERARR